MVRPEIDEQDVGQTSSASRGALLKLDFIHEAPQVCFTSAGLSVDFRVSVLFCEDLFSELKITLIQLELILSLAI